MPNNEGTKYDGDKLRYDLIPTGPLAEVAKVYTIGAKKYDDRNWELGLKWGRVYGALQRHANAFWSGERLDPKDGQHHLASVVWCALALMEYERTHPELDDRKELVKAGEQMEFPDHGIPLSVSPEPMADPTYIQFSYGARVECPICELWYNEGDIHVCLPLAHD